MELSHNPGVSDETVKLINSRILKVLATVLYIYINVLIKVGRAKLEHGRLPQSSLVH